MGLKPQIAPRRPRMRDIFDRFPADDGVPVENRHHDENREPLRSSFRRWLAARGRTAYIAGNNFVYYDIKDPNHNVGPDLFIVLDVEDDPKRDCWRAFMEDDRLPDLIVEMVSKGSARKDWVTNMAIYQDTLRVPNYVILDDRPLRRPRHALLTGFKLVNGKYVEVPRTPQGRVFCDAVGLYLGMHDDWLRWFDTDGNLLPTDAEAEKQLADQARRGLADARRDLADARRNAEEADHRAEEADHRAEEAYRRAEAETRRADEAAAEIERLRRLLGET